MPGEPVPNWYYYRPRHELWALSLRSDLSSMDWKSPRSSRGTPLPMSSRGATCQGFRLSSWHAAYRTRRELMETDSGARTVSNVSFADRSPAFLKRAIPSR